MRKYKDKRKIVFLTILFISTLFIKQKVYSVELNNLEIEVDKDVVHPGEEVNLNIDFNQKLSEYNVSIAYDSNLFEFESLDGGSSEGEIYDNGNIIEIVYPEEAGNLEAQESIDVKFKAKEEITETNPTDLKVTLQGLVEENGENIDNPAQPISKELTVEPVYKNYKIEISYDGEIIENEIKNMEIVINSEMGKNYKNTKLIAEVILKPENSEVSFLGTDSSGVEHDIIKEGWGAENGDLLGGKDVIRKLNIRGVFTEQGSYTIKLKVVDIKNSNHVIASETFNFVVTEAISTEDEGKDENEGNTTNTVDGDTASAESSLDTDVSNLVENESTEESSTLVSQISDDSTTTINKTEESSSDASNEITKIPKAGNMIYVYIIPIIILLLVLYWILSKVKSKEKNKKV